MNSYTTCFTSVIQLYISAAIECSGNIYIYTCKWRFYPNRSALWWEFIPSVSICNHNLFGLTDRRDHHHSIEIWSYDNMLHSITCWSLNPWHLLHVRLNKNNNWRHLNCKWCPAPWKNCMFPCFQVQFTLFITKNESGSRLQNNNNATLKSSLGNDSTYNGIPFCYCRQLWIKNACKLRSELAWVRVISNVCT